MPEQIGNADTVSRLIIEPTMVQPESIEWIWERIFEFPSQAGRAESVVWRAKCVSDADVNARGCELEEKQRLFRPERRYRGFMNAAVQEIRQCSTKRCHRFEVIHEPAEGDWHAHIVVVPAGEISKNDKSDIRAAMQRLFDGFLSQSC